MAPDLSISSFIQEKLPVTQKEFFAVKRKVLGAHYHVSVAIIGPSRSKSLNKKLRKKDTPANVLSLSLGKESGEILITPYAARKSAREFEEPYKKHIVRLFIHATLHLKGHQHGHTMERAEERLLEEFSA